MINSHESSDWLEDIILNLKMMLKRPGLFFTKYPDYDTSVSFVEGYLYSFSSRYNSKFVTLHGKNIWIDINDWFAHESGYKSNQLLSYTIKEQFKNLDNEALIQKYLNTLIDFFESRKYL